GGTGASAATRLAARASCQRPRCRRAAEQREAFGAHDVSSDPPARVGRQRWRSPLAGQDSAPRTPTNVLQTDARHCPPQSSSASRRTASHAGFLLLSQSGERPERYGESFRFDTMPSRPILQAWANTVEPSASMCSLSRRPDAARLNTDANVALLVSSGSRRRSSPFNSIRSKAYRNTLASWRR